MRKTRLILIIAVIALLAVGGAYAAWTSRVTISANASAGEMDVEISSVSVGAVSEYVEFATDSISVSEDRKSATVSIRNLYPGAEANATIVITNIGTIPVMLSNASQLRELAVNTETNDTLAESVSDMLVVQYTARADTKTGQVKASDASAETTETLFQNTGMIIEAGKTIAFDLHITLEKEAPEEAENVLFRFQFIPMFIQSNMEASGGGSSGGAQVTEVPAATDPASEETDKPEDTGSDFEKSFSDTASYLIEKIEDHYAETGRYGRTWDTYAYTDIGLNAEDWTAPIQHVVYSPSGANLYIRPEAGYTFTVESMSGETMKLPERYKWNLVYSSIRGKWYYHTITQSNEINIDTLSVARD